MINLRKTLTLLIIFSGIMPGGASAMGMEKPNQAQIQAQRLLSHKLTIGNLKGIEDMARAGFNNKSFLASPDTTIFNAFTNGLDALKKRLQLEFHEAWQTAPQEFATAQQEGEQRKQEMLD